MDRRIEAELIAYKRLRPHPHLQYHDVPVPQGWQRESQASWVFTPNGLRAEIRFEDGVATALIVGPDLIVRWSLQSEVQESDATSLVVEVVRQMVSYSIKARLPSNRSIDQGKADILYKRFA